MHASIPCSNVHFCLHLHKPRALVLKSLTLDAADDLWSRSCQAGACQGWAPQSDGSILWAAAANGESKHLKGVAGVK
jgi:hypothetical protein